MSASSAAETMRNRAEYDKFVKRLLGKYASGDVQTDLYVLREILAGRDNETLTKLATLAVKAGHRAEKNIALGSPGKITHLGGADRRDAIQAFKSELTNDANALNNPEGGDYTKQFQASLGTLGIPLQTLWDEFYLVTTGSGHTTENSYSVQPPPVPDTQEPVADATITHQPGDALTGGGDGGQGIDPGGDEARLGNLAPTDDAEGSTGGSGGSGGDGGSGTGGGGSGGTDGNVGGSEDPFETDAGNIAGGYEIWRNNGGQLYLSYEVGEGSGTFVVWSITSEDMDNLGHLFNDGNPTIDRETTGAELSAMGVWNAGGIDELNNPSEDPFKNFWRDLEKEAEIRPWLLDPEIVEITAEAMLEGRQVTEAELMTTAYMRGKSQAELDWIIKSSRSTETAKDELDDNKQAVRGWLEDAGVFGVSEGMVDLLARKWTTGAWSQGKMLHEIDKLANPTLGELDAELAEAASGQELSLVSEQINEVRELVTRWLGPHFSEKWSDDELERWARDIHGDPTKEQDLVNALKQQRVALFPNYENENLSYETIAAPWLRFMQSAWGETPDEADPFVHQIINMNDSAEASRALRTEGMKRGIGKVSEDMLAGLGGALGNGIVQQR